MTIKTTTPYLTLADGKASDAIALYETALGAKLQNIQRYGDIPGTPPEMKQRVMHAVLQVGGGTLMLSDGSPEQKAGPGGSLHIALEIDDAAQGRAAFDALSKGGTVHQPLIDAPWGASFGALQDRFGINWMFNVAKG